MPPSKKMSPKRMSPEMEQEQFHKRITDHLVMSLPHANLMFRSAVAVSLAMYINSSGQHADIVQDYIKDDLNIIFTERNDEYTFKSSMPVLNAPDQPSQSWLEGFAAGFMDGEKDNNPYENHNGTPYHEWNSGFDSAQQYASDWEDSYRPPQLKPEKSENLFVNTARKFDTEEFTCYGSMGKTWMLILPDPDSDEWDRNEAIINLCETFREEFELGLGLDKEPEVKPIKEKPAIEASKLGTQAAFDTDLSSADNPYPQNSQLWKIWNLSYSNTLDNI